MERAAHPARNLLCDAPVNNALCGCDKPCPTQLPTRTPTATFTPPSPPPTPTPEFTQVLFSEGWQRARVGTYRPRPDVPLGGDVIGGDTGDWVVVDTVTNFPDCGESPHFAEIVNEDGSLRLRIHSANSNSDCADNIDVGAITRNPPAARGVDVDLDDDIYLSFHETGQLNANKDCDAASLTVTFDNLAPLTYVLQRGPGWEIPQNCTSLLVTPNAVVLDPNAIEYTRNLIADALAADLARPSRITSLALTVDSDGSATFDDIRVLRAKPTGPTNTPTFTPTRTPTPAPCTCIRVQQGPWCLEVGFLGSEARLTQSGCTITFSDQSLRGPICGSLWVVDNPQLEAHFECDFDGGNPATECSGFIETPDGSGDVFMHAGACEGE